MRRSSGCGSGSSVDSATYSKLEIQYGCRSNITWLQVELRARPFSFVRPGGRVQPEARLGEFDLHRYSPCWHFRLEARLDLNSNASGCSGGSPGNRRAAASAGTAKP